MAGKNKKNKSSSKRSKRNTLLIISFLASLIAIAFFFYTNPNGLNGARSRTINIPTIDKKIKSASSEEDYYISTDVMIVLERSRGEKYADIKSAVEDAVSELDYDKVSGDDMSYIKDSITGALSDFVNPEAGMKVYITGLQSGSEPIIHEYEGPRKATLPVIR